MLQFTPEEIQAITMTARYSGKLVTAHAYTSEAIRHAVDNGVRGIEHGNFIDAATAAYCKEKDVVVTPTLVVYNAYEKVNKPPFENLLPPEGKDKNREVLKSGLEALEILHKAGVTMCYGSDLLSVLHPLQTEEFSIRAKVLPAAEILRSATTNAAKYLGMAGQLGQVKPGAIADFLILERNPLQDITLLDRAKDTLLAVVKDGRVVSSAISEVLQDPFYQDYELLK
jgi:imidazolonepropionase-like amidohydrolase